MQRYTVIYSEDALYDLSNIFEYIFFNLKEPFAAISQTNRIRSLDVFANRCKVVDFEPWKSRGLKQLSIDNFNVFYSIDNIQFYIYRSYFL